MKEFMEIPMAGKWEIQEFESRQSALRTHAFTHYTHAGHGTHLRPPTDTPAPHLKRQFIPFMDKCHVKIFSPDQIGTSSMPLLVWSRGP